MTTRGPQALVLLVTVLLPAGCSKRTAEPQQAPAEHVIKVNESKQALQEGLRILARTDEPGAAKPTNLKGTTIFVDEFLSFVNSRTVSDKAEGKKDIENVKDGKRYLLFQCTDGLVQLSLMQGSMRINGRAANIIEDMSER
jgi:hypothetical protein